MKKLIVDPPEGWKYGFPKPIPEDIIKTRQSFEAWLIEQGYPIDELGFAVKYSRYWETDDETNCD